MGFGKKFLSLSPISLRRDNLSTRGSFRSLRSRGQDTIYLFIMKLRAKGGAPDQALEAMAVVVVVAADIRLRVAAPRKSQGR